MVQHQREDVLISNYYCRIDPPIDTKKHHTGTKWSDGLGRIVEQVNYYVRAVSWLFVVWFPCLLKVHQSSSYQFTMELELGHHNPMIGQFVGHLVSCCCVYIIKS